MSRGIADAPDTALDTSDLFQFSWIVHGSHIPILDTLRPGFQSRFVVLLALSSIGFTEKDVERPCDVHIAVDVFFPDEVGVLPQRGLFEFQDLVGDLRVVLGR